MTRLEGIESLSKSNRWYEDLTREDVEYVISLAKEAEAFRAKLDIVTTALAFYADDTAFSDQTCLDIASDVLKKLGFTGSSEGNPK